VNECSITSTLCSSDQVCENTVGSYVCRCISTGLLSVNGQCTTAAPTTATTSTAGMTTVTSSLNVDHTGLALAIALPIIVFLILVGLAVGLCYMWFKTKAARKEKEKLEKDAASWSNGKSMFFRENEGKTERVNVDGMYTSGGAGDRTIYRTQYPFENKFMNEKDFFKSLEGNYFSFYYTPEKTPQFFVFTKNYENLN